MDSTKDTFESKKLSPEEFFNFGRRYYITGDYSKALEYLVKACQLMESRYGPLSDEIYDTYYYLSKAYYHYSKRETQLIPEGLEDDKDASKDHKSDDHTDLKNEPGNEESTSIETKPADEEESDVLNQDESGDEETATDSKETESYLQLSYETIECAKLVLKRQLQEKKFEESELEQKLADCCDIVGNIYMEEGVINEAIEEYQKSLVIRQKHASNCDRSIAETLFNLGMAFMVEQRFPEAIPNYEKCKSIMVQCHSSALAKGEEGKQLAEIIAELDEKILECQEGERDYRLAKESIQEFMKTPTSNIPLTDVTHLIKRKKTSQSNDSGSQEPQKKIPKLEEENLSKE